MTRRSKKASVAEHLRLGVFFYRSGSYDLAIEQFLAASKRAPHTPNVWLNLGATYIDQGELAKAKMALERALRLKPDYGSAFFHLGQLYDEDGDAEKARECFKRVILLEPHSEIGRRAKERVEGFHPRVVLSLHQESSK
jgi:tetratricopeptide (TPR) repeat protein